MLPYKTTGKFIWILESTKTINMKAENIDLVESFLNTPPIRGKVSVRKREKLSRHTTFRIGGEARFFIEPVEDTSLSGLMKAFSEQGIGWRIIGGGSNILVSDDGIDEPVLSLRRCRNFIIPLSRKTVVFPDGLKTSRVKIRVGGGVSLKRLLGICIRMGWSGCEFLTGIPATVGGAVFMNAGTSERSMADITSCLEIMTSSGDIYFSHVNSFPVGYRSFGVPVGHIILGAEIELIEEAREKVFNRIRSIMMRRKSTQPLTYPSAGCIFKNPPGDNPPAGWLIDRCGLKGYRIGNSQISTVHANWIINLGGAKATEVLTIIEHTKEEVFKTFGILLEEEIKLWG